jgi:hypothetical protein
LNSIAELWMWFRDVIPGCDPVPIVHSILAPF